MHVLITNRQHRSSYQNSKTVKENNSDNKVSSDQLTSTNEFQSKESSHHEDDVENDTSKN